MPHLDALRFEKQAGGSPAVMLRVAQAFSRQLPAWRADFAAAAARPEELAPLLHKIKGSCHAISATGAAAAFEQAEQSLQAPGFDAEALTQQLLALLVEIEAELQALSDGSRA